MPIRQELPINNHILLWAREQTKFSIDDVVARAKIKDLKNKGISAKERLMFWESGKENPTIGELELIAKAYRRPLLTFFLPNPPMIETRLQDFRTIGDKVIEKPSPEFDAFRRQVEVLQKGLQTLVQNDGGKPLDFIGSVKMDYLPEKLADNMHKILGYSADDQQKIKDSDELFNMLRDKAGKAGIFVLRKADLGSWHSKITPQEFRGLAICDNFAPLIVVNPNDAKAALPFTLIHELVHLWLGESGISSFDLLQTQKQNYQKREIYCNRTAAEFLVPSDSFLEEWRKIKNYNLDLAILSLTNTFKVSRVVIARRLLEFEKIDEDTYWNQFNQWRDEWITLREEQKHEEGGPGYFISTKSKLGTKLLETVIKAAYDGKISYGEASKMLGIKIDHFNQFYGG
jgi:Zn-dependent peptidase ImmA (M78 family)